LGARSGVRDDAVVVSELTSDRVAMNRRRACLVVPATPAAKLAKGRGLAADEVVLDLEDAVVPAAKEQARADVVRALAGEWAAESVAVRVNAIGSSWCHVDLVALAASERVALTVVLPKVESVGDVAFADRLLAGAEAAAGRRERVRLLALIETAAGLAGAVEIARASERLDGLVLGYADLAASLGRAGDPAPRDWLHAQETVLVAARAAGVQAIDGPHLGIRDDDAFRAAVAHARGLGFDGKWAIHPAQLDALREAFTPSAEEVAGAREVLDALGRAAADGAGAVAVDGRMLDEALALSARRVLARAGAER
jgi:citrate lyase subunit beta/citryl-CoA lyase